MNSADVLQIYKTGKLSVVGFGGVDVPDEYCISGHIQDLEDLIEKHGCEILAFDLTGVRFIPSGMLGVLCSLRDRHGVHIQLFNASDDVREAVQVAKLDQMFSLAEVRI